MAPLPAEVLVVVRRLVGPLDDRGLLDLLLPVEPLQALQVAVDDQIGDDGPLLPVERHPLVVRADHRLARVAAHRREGPVPEDDPVVAVDDEGRDGRALADPLDGLAQPDVGLELPLERLGLLLEGALQLPLAGDVLEGFHGRNDLALLVQDRGGQEVRVPALPAEVLVEVRRLVGPLDDRGLLDLLLPVERLETRGVAVHDEIGDDGPLLGVEGYPLLLRPDHPVALEPAHLREGPVPEQDPVVAVDDEGRDRRSLDDPLDGLAQADVLVELPPERLGVLLEVARELTLPGDVLERLDGCDDLAVVVVHRGGQEVEVARFSSQTLEEIRRLVGPLDHGRFPDLLAAVIPFERLHVLVHDEIGDEGPPLGIEGPVVIARADHVPGVIARQLGAGLVPENDRMIAVDDKGGNGRPLEDALDGEARPVFCRADGLFLVGPGHRHDSSSSCPAFFLLFSSYQQAT